jgi:energy-coupling factor transporter ATP-binding protein EcfA2
MEALTAEQAEKLVDLVIHKCLNCIVAGATGSGKTTLLKALQIGIPSNERLVTPWWFEPRVARESGSASKLALPLISELSFASAP